ncbi:hypothetical protein HELRODRAFT_81197, partial [Helobdella robusta]|uniref:MATH domain-containing protein n=1 Tax=Helobdella robusta TaxID=6412 RepID=T1G4B0_HELRO
RNFEELRLKLINIDRFIGSYNINLNDLDNRFQNLEQTSYNGVLLWKVTNYREHKNKAVIGQTTSLYSQSFYTSRYGYKMCARIYLNGDGIGNGTHISMFFVIMKGDYDTILEWPFRHKVTLMILDRSGNECHISDSFLPDPRSSSYQKPTSACNVASGCPMFATQSDIEENRNFLNDDCLFIKIIVKNI